MDKNRELSIKIINEFENLLVKYNLKIPNEERQNNEDESCIYGKDYFYLEDKITQLLNHKVN